MESIERWLARDSHSRDLHVAYSICGENWDGYIGLTSLVSLLHARETLGTYESKARQLHVHLAMDADASQSLPRTLQYQRLLRYIERTPQVHLHRHLLDDISALRVKVNPLTHLFRKCSGGRLQLMRQLQDVPRVLYIDWDTVVLCDLASRWDALFDGMAASDAGFAMAPEGLISSSGDRSSWYLRHGLPTGIPGGYNAGVVAIRPAYFNQRAHGLTMDALFDEFAGIAASGGYRSSPLLRSLYTGNYTLELGDQVRSFCKIVFCDSHV
jgi:hypothetical protein